MSLLRVLWGRNGGVQLAVLTTWRGRGWEVSGSIGSVTGRLQFRITASQDHFGTQSCSSDLDRYDDLDLTYDDRKQRALGKLPLGSRQYGSLYRARGRNFSIFAVCLPIYLPYYGQVILEVSKEHRGPFLPALIQLPWRNVRDSNHIASAELLNASTTTMRMETVIYYLELLHHKEDKDG